MKQYLDILRDILENGEPKQPTRMDVNGNAVKVEDGTIGVFCREFRHNMQDGFPLVTTKKMPIKTIAVELEGFIKGVTDKRWFQERGCNIWNEWSNPSGLNPYLHNMANNPEDNKEGLDVAGLRKKYQKENMDLGPIYGYQWRKFGEAYYYGQLYDYTEKYQKVPDDFNGIEEGFDQLKSIVEKLKSNPYDRRMVCSAWNPNQMHLMALPPCHYSFTVNVYGDKLNLKWNQRSCDFLLGVPFNIASYAILLKLLAKESGLKEGELIGSLEDCHIYEHHIDAVKEQLSREPFPLPQLNIPDEGWNGIFKWTHKDLELTNYQHHDPIKARVTV